MRAVVVSVEDGPDRGLEASQSSDELSIGTAADNDLVLTDTTVSGYHLVLKADEHGISVLDRESRNGTFASDAVRIQRGIVHPGALIRVGRTSIRIGDGGTVDLELSTSASVGGMVGRSAAMRLLFARVEKAAAAEAPVLIHGESGTGKELVARALHDLGPRAAHKMITVDCGSLVPTLVASELFGHERGAFTGADRRHEGAFERVGPGTIFLDEIGELPESLQVTLLGVLERRKFRRLGGRDEIAFEGKVIAATHRDLRADVNAGRFRLDLFFRLAVAMLHVPALRERPDDLHLLIEHFARAAGHSGPIDELFPPLVMSQIVRHDWPGNIRELRNVVEVRIAMGETPPLGTGSTPPPAEVDRIALAPMLTRSYVEARGEVLSQFELFYLRGVLERADGNVAKAARDAGMDRSYLHDLMKRHGLR